MAGPASIDPSLLWDTNTSLVDINLWLSTVAEGNTNIKVFPEVICYKTSTSKQRYIDRLASDHVDLPSYEAGATISASFTKLTKSWIAFVESAMEKIHHDHLPDWHASVLIHINQKWLIFCPGFTPPTDPDEIIRIREKAGLRSVFHLMQLMKANPNNPTYTGLGDGTAYLRRKMNTDNIFITGIPDDELKCVPLSAAFIKQFLAGHFGEQDKSSKPHMKLRYLSTGRQGDRETGYLGEEIQPYHIQPKSI